MISLSHSAKASGLSKQAAQVVVNKSHNGVMNRLADVALTTSTPFSLVSPSRHEHRRVRYMSTNNAYLHETKIPMYHFQKSLPRMPIPPLDKTLERYLASVEAVTTPEQFEEVKKSVEEFKNGPGPALQQKLEERDKLNKHTSYINKWWFDMYVESRDALPINVNPAMMWKLDPNPKKNEHAQRAASIISSSVKFFRTFRDKKLQPDVFHTNPKKSKTNLYDSVCRMLPEQVSFYGSYFFGAYPLDMSQYENLFQSTRLPKVGKDMLHKYPHSRHIVVQRGAEFFAFDVLNVDGTAIPEAQILANVKSILSKPVVGSKKAPAVGLFTTLDRDTWAQTRESFTRASINKASIEAIDSAIFVVTLEEEAPATDLDMFVTFLTGNGVNRWFDKSFEVIVCKNGQAGLNFEHSWGDGVAVLRYMNEVYDDSVKSDPIEGKSEAHVKQLKFEVDNAVQDQLAKTEADFSDWLKRLNINIVDVPSVDRTIGKKYNIGTDGFMQMAIQLGHYKLHKKTVSTYESASTAAFKHGRTETIRSATLKSNDFVKAFINPNATLEEKASKLRDAVTFHGTITKDALMGNGFDRHLFALRKLSEEKGAAPSIFTTKGKQIMDKIILSTSTLSSPALQGGGFGPVNDECYGIGYGIEHSTRFAVTCYRPDGKQFAKKLEESVLEMVDVLKKAPVPPVAK